MDAGRDIGRDHTSGDSARFGCTAERSRGADAVGWIAIDIGRERPGGGGRGESGAGDVGRRFRNDVGESERVCSVRFESCELPVCVRWRCEWIASSLDEDPADDGGATLSAVAGRNVRRGDAFLRGRVVCVVESRSVTDGGVRSGPFASATVRSAPARACGRGRETGSVASSPRIIARVDCEMYDIEDAGDGEGSEMGSSSGDGTGLRATDILRGLRSHDSASATQISWADLLTSTAGPS